MAEDGTLSQRDLAKKMGLSLGRVNYVVNALLKKGYLKAKIFRNSRNKMGYLYTITPKGVNVKMARTFDFLQEKLTEFERLKQEIEVLRREADSFANKTWEQEDMTNRKRNKL